MTHRDEKELLDWAIDVYQQFGVVPMEDESAVVIDLLNREQVEEARKKIQSHIFRCDLEHVVKVEYAPFMSIKYGKKSPLVMMWQREKTEDLDIISTIENLKSLPDDAGSTEFLDCIVDRKYI